MDQGIHARSHTIAGIFFFALVSFLSAPLGYCEASAPASPQPQLAARAKTASPAAARDARSCRVFVQEFYDWYWNRFANKVDLPDFDSRTLPSLEMALEKRPSAFSPALYRLLAHEEQEMERTGEIGALDFDPILASQDPEGKYMVGNVTVSANRCAASVRNGDLDSVELERSGPSWAIANFRYVYASSDGKSKSTADDLVNFLRRSSFK